LRLNVYADHADAFDDHDIMSGLLLAVHGASAVEAIAAREEAEHLRRALISNRRIGMAMGILMAGDKVTDAQAFDLLRIASQSCNRKIVDIAQDVTDA
jgi:AmiR/NasT family two-component response regulator